MIEVIVILSLILLTAGIAVRPIRKSFGLLLIVLGILECLSMFGIVLGIPSMLIGGMMLNYEGKSREDRIRDKVLYGKNRVGADINESHTDCE